jgi:putative pre-16S rRNA nuclease
MTESNDSVYMGIDYGDRRTGLAISDASGTIAGGYKTINASSPKSTAELIRQEFAEIQPVGLVVGYPVAPDGGAGERCVIVDRFVAEMRKVTELPIYRQEERGTTQAAQAVIHAHGKKVTRKRKKSGALDQIAAALILQRWLDNPQRFENDSDVADTDEASR